MVFWSGITKPSTLSVLGGLCGGGDASFGQAGERGFVGGDVRAVFCGGQEFGVEGIRQGRNLFVELPQFSLVGFREFSAGMYELVIGTLQQAERLGIKLERRRVDYRSRIRARRVSC